VGLCGTGHCLVYWHDRPGADVLMMKLIRWLINLIFYGVLIVAAYLLAMSLIKIADFILGA
jgi:hypothetical protein